MSARRKCLHLYWVTTPDHDEDWFIIAFGPRSAERFHERYEGYNPGDATAEIVMRNIDMKPEGGNTPPFHAQLDHLQALGCVTFQIAPGQRGVLRNGRLFTEGQMEALATIATDNLAEAAGLGRPQGTTRPSQSIKAVG